MFSTVLLWSCFVVSAFTSKCGNPPVCWCTNAVGIILCKNIDKLPFFNAGDKNTGIFLDLINTGITELPNFRSWPILEMIAIRNSTHLCNITIDKPEHVWLDSDCPGHQNLENIVQGEHHYKLRRVDWPYLLLLIPLFFIGLFIGYEVRMKGNTIQFYRKKKGSKTSDNVSLTNIDDRK